MCCLHCAFSMDQPKYLSFGKELTISQTTNLDPSKLEEFADDNFKFYENGRKLSKWLENMAGQREIARYKQFLRFPVFSKDLYCRHAKPGTVWERALIFNLSGIFHNNNS